MRHYRTRFFNTANRTAAIAMFASLSIVAGANVAKAGQLGSCPGVDEVEANLNHVSSSGYYLPGLKLIVLNKTILDRYALPVQKFIFAHECSHSDPAVLNEDDADCAAAKRGAKEGWLGRSELIQVCVHLGHMPADAEHKPVESRCANIRRCMTEPDRQTARLTPLDRGGP